MTQTELLPVVADLAITEEVLADVLRQTNLVSVRELERARAKQARTGYTLREILLPNIPWGHLRRVLDSEVSLSGGRTTTLGEVLVEAHWITREQFDDSLREEERAGLALARVLLVQNVITSEQLAKAREYCERTGVSLWRALINLDYALPVEITQAFHVYSRFPFLAYADEDLADRLVRAGHLDRDTVDQLLSECDRCHDCLLGMLRVRELVDEKDLARTQAEQFGFEYAEPEPTDLDPDLVNELPHAVMVKLQALPIAREDNGLVVMLADPTRVSQLEGISEMLGVPIRPVVGPPSLIERALDHWVVRSRRSEDRSDPRKLLISARVQVTEDLGEDESIARLTDSIMAGAIAGKATDLHLESQERGLRVRYRIDGVLHDVVNLPDATGISVISRIKVLSNLDIVERRRSQDGHLEFRGNGRAVDMRVSTVPGYLGESVVIRIISEDTVVTGLAQLGLEPAQRALVDSLLAKPYGMLLAAGPVGSGKTTTMYACLNQINILSRNVMTIEDPVEYRLKGTNQLQVDYRRGFDFAAGLRAILRQDPDTIMIGEIRDNETARIAVRAALTGVLVFSTLHGNDAATTVNSLYQYEIPSFLISNALLGVIAQRLVRKVCPDCRIEYQPGDQVYRQLGLDPDQYHGTPFYRGRGCAKCFHTGYSGRTGVYEVMQVNDEVRELVNHETTKEAIYRTAVELGMQPLRTSGINKILSGETTVDEFFRVIFT